MRETNSSLLQTAKDYVSNDETTSSTNISDVQTFLKKEINKTIRFMYTKLGIYKSQKTQTAVSVADQQFYHLPPDIDTIQSVTYTISSVKYPLQPIDSYQEWNDLNQVDFAPSTIPQYYFTRRDDFGIWPTPSTAGETITLTYNYLLKDLSVSDYTTGTVTTAQNSTTITGSGTTFTAAMVGRWFQATDDGDWYRISAFTSTTVITLESAFEGSAVSGSAFTIGQSPEIPSELHELIPHRAAAMYFLGPLQNKSVAQAHNNFFFTGDPENSRRSGRGVSGGLIEFVNRYKSQGRSGSKLVRRGRRLRNLYNERWSTVLT